MLSTNYIFHRVYSKPTSAMNNSNEKLTNLSLSREQETNKMKKRPLLEDDKITSTNYDTSIEGSAPKRPHISEREENDHPKDELSGTYYDDPLSVAACMLTKCPLCNISKCGSNVFYLSPCQHRICRSCWLNRCDSNFRTIKRRCLGKGKRVALCPCHFCRGRTPPPPSCPTCETKVTHFFMFYRKKNFMGKLAHFSALPRCLTK